MLLQKRKATMTTDQVETRSHFSTDLAVKMR